MVEESVVITLIPAHSGSIRPSLTKSEDNGPLWH